MKNKIRIASAANTMVPAYLLLVENGFKVTRTQSSQSDGDTWTATKEGIELIGEDPLELLGLSRLFEVRGSKWGATDRQIDTFMEDFDYGT
jgi:hypothetical protein